MPLPSALTELLSRLLAEPTLATKNTAYDASFQTYVLDRVNSLTPDQVQWFGAPEVDTVTDLPTGSLEPDVNANAVILDTAGFQYALSQFRDGVQRAPRRIRRRAPGVAIPTTGTDRVRYLVAGATDGVLLLDDNLEIVRTFPNFNPAGAPVGATEYNDAECAVAATPTTAATEHMFIACGGAQHVVQIYDYATGAHVSTIGTPGTPGVPSVAGDLTEPVAVAVDETNDLLFIACRTGDAPGSDAASNGFVAEFDISVIGTPAFVQYHLIAGGLNKLNNAECERPTDVFFVPGATVPDERLWVANGLGDVAAFDRPGAGAYQPAMVMEAIGPGYVLGPNGTTGATLAQNSIDLLTGSDGSTRLYVSADLSGRVEVFRVSGGTDLAPGAHESSYGFLGSENALPYGVTLPVQASNRDPLLTFGSIANASGVVADELTLVGDSVASSLVVIADRNAGRLQRLRSDVYEDANTVTYLPQTSDVPVCVVGWFLPADATFHPDHLTLEVRDPGDATATPAIPATAWREVPRAGFSVAVQGPAQTRYQFRLRATLDRTAPVKAFSTGAVGVLLRQQW